MFPRSFRPIAVWLLLCSLVVISKSDSDAPLSNSSISIQSNDFDSIESYSINSSFIPMAKYTAPCKILTSAELESQKSLQISSSVSTEPCLNMTTHMPNRTLFWMHIQKTSSWLNNFLVVWACPNFCRDYLLENDLAADTSDIEKPVIYDFQTILKKREINSMEVMTVFMKCSISFKNYALTKFGWSQFGFHWPMNHESMKGNTITLFRKPLSRIISAFLFDMMLPQGFGNRTPEVKQQWREHINKTDSPVYAYSQIPGIANCQTKMVLGFRCGVPMNLTRDQMNEAIIRVQKDFYFIGLTEESDASANLFLAMHGAEGGLPLRKTLSELTDPPFRFTHYRRSRHHSANNHIKYEQQMIAHGWKDEFDEAVFRTAANMFYDRCKQYNIVTKHKSIEDLYAHPHRYF